MTPFELSERNEELERQTQQLNEENIALKESVAYKDLVIAKLQKMLFGPKSERFIAQAEASQQLNLFCQAIETLATQEVETETISYERNKPSKTPKTGKGRVALPDHLPRVDLVIEPEEDITGMIKIDEEISEILDIIPPKFQVIRVIRPIYGFPGGRVPTSLEAQLTNHQLPSTDPAVATPRKKIVVAPMPARVIDKSIPSTRLLVFLLVSKFVDHLPYYRQVNMFKRYGIQLNTKTINGWIARCCVLLDKLYTAFCEYQFSKSYLQADETTIKVLKVKKGGAHTGYYWVYYDPLDDQVVFIYDPGRGRKYPIEHLKNFKGKLQTDGLSVYDVFEFLEGCERIGCMAHARRKFVEALDNDKARASKVLIWIQQIYDVEQEARDKNLSAEQRKILRQEKAAPIIKQIKTYLDKLHDNPVVLPKSAIGQAVQYALNQWPYLVRYLEDGQLEIDNNLVENSIRPVAIGRKNYLFAGSPTGAKWGAIVYTLVASAIRQGINPMDYLADVLRRIPDTKPSQYHTLFPCNWKAKPTERFDIL